jgi:hypothetical protein
MTAVVLVYLGLFLIFVGVITTVKPPKFLQINSRARGALVLVIGVAMGVGGFAMPAPEVRVAVLASRLDEFAPVYQFREFHSIRVDAPADRAYAAIKQVSADEIPLFQTLTWIRRGGRPSAPGILNAPEHQPLLAVATRTSFLLLAEEPNREIVIGTAVLVPKGWRLNRQPTPEDFQAVRGPGFALASMNFFIQPEGTNACVLTTETRIYATDSASVAKFARYWRIIDPGSALIRRMWLRAIKRRAESESKSPLQAIPAHSSTIGTRVFPET